MFRPLLSPNNDPLNTPTFFDDLTFPLLASYKFDGIRGIGKDGVLKSRNYKDIPSAQAQEMFSKCQEMDGELICGSPVAEDVYNTAQSYIMSGVNQKVHPDLKFYVFDWAEESKAHWPFKARYSYLHQKWLELNDPQVKLVYQKEILDLEQLFVYEEKALESGFEGLMLRNYEGVYKHNRATYKEWIIKKLKRPVDEEGLIVGFEEGFTNNNPKIDNELGFAKRTSHQENKVLAGTLGKFLVLFKGQVIKVGPGSFKHDERQEIWDNQFKYLNTWLRFRHFPIGAKDMPRQPRAKGFWSPEHAS